MAEGGVAPATFYAESEYEVRSLKSLKEKFFLYFGPEVVRPPLLRFKLCVMWCTGHRTMEVLGKEPRDYAWLIEG